MMKGGDAPDAWRRRQTPPGIRPAEKRRRRPAAQAGLCKKGTAVECGVSPDTGKPCSARCVPDMTKGLF